MLVRKIQYTDINGFRDALSSVALERKYLLTLSPPSLSNVSEFVQKNIDNNNAQYVAEVNGIVVGWIDIVPGEPEAIRHTGLLGMGIVANHRGKGIGTELMKQAISHAWQTGLKRIELEVFATNTVAISLYKTNGFILEGTKLNARLVDQRYQDVHLMAQCRL